MDASGLHDSVISHLQQAHAMERAQVGELRTMSDEMPVPAIATLLRTHGEETERQGERIEARLSELGAASSLRLLAQSFGTSIPKALLDRMRPDDACAILRDAIAAEAGEIAGYLLLEAEAIRAGDESTEVLASELRATEAATRDELMGFWNQVVDHRIAMLTERTSGSGQTRIAKELLVDHLQNVQALERNAAIMLSVVVATIDDELARQRISDHRDATQRHGDVMVERLRELGSRPSLRKQAQGFAFAAMKGPVNLVRSERTARELRDMYVVEHLELVGYGLLAAIAQRCGDERTLQLAQTHAAEEAAMVDWLEREAARFLLESLRDKA